MQTPTLLTGTIAILIVGFFILLIYFKRNRKVDRNSNYKPMFAIGISWIPLGVALDIKVFSVIGCVLLLIALINKDKWKDEDLKIKKWSELDPEIRKRKVMMIVLLVVLLLAGIVTFVMKKEDVGSLVVNDFNSCAEAGNPIMESYPQKCRDGEGGEIYIENLGNKLEMLDSINLISIQPNQKISSPLVLEGSAKAWYFEGNFPVILTDWDGEIIAQGFVSSVGEWMTNEFVPFKGILEFEKPDFDNRGTLILQKDNPSDKRELDEALEIPVLFE